MKQPAGKRRVALRCAGDGATGFQRVRRCAGIARALAKRGVETHVVSDEHPVARRALADLGDRARFVAEPNEGFHAAGRDFGCVVVDAGNASVEAAAMWKTLARRLVCVDDFGEAPALADALILAGSGAADVFVPRAVRDELGARVYQGFEYAVVDERHLAHRASLKKDMSGRRALVCFGDVDREGLTRRVVELLAESSRMFRLDIVLGSCYEGTEGDLPLRHNVNALRDPEDLAELMSGAGIAICGAGSEFHSLCMMGTPCILIANDAASEVQSRIAEIIGAAIYVGRHDAFEPRALVNAVDRLFGDAIKWNDMRQAGIATVDGRGAERIAEIIHDLMM